LFAYQKPGADLCDATLDSFCDQGPANDCLVYGHNDGWNGIYYDGFTGWIIMKPRIKYGYIAIKFEAWHKSGENPETEGWTSIDNEGDTRVLSETVRDATTYSLSTEQTKRQLKKKPPVPFCDEFRFEYAIDGKVTSLDKDGYDKLINKLQRLVNVATSVSRHSI
jgi:hypothetical protein